MKFKHIFIEDVERIQKICKKHGYDLTLEECQIGWDNYSYSLAAGWIGLDEEEESVWENIKPYINLQSGLKDKVIKSLIEQQWGVEVDEYNIQGIVKEGEITKIKIDVKPVSFNDFVEVTFQLKHKTTKKP